MVVFPFLLRKRETFFTRFNAFPFAPGGRIKTQARESSLNALLLYSSPAPLNSTNNIEPGQKDQYSKEHFPQPSWNVNAYVLEINYIELSRPPSFPPNISDFWCPFPLGNFWGRMVLLPPLHVYFFFFLLVLTRGFAYVLRAVA